MMLIRMMGKWEDTAVKKTLEMCILNELCCMNEGKYQEEILQCLILNGMKSEG